MSFHCTSWFWSLLFPMSQAISEPQNKNLKPPGDRGRFFFSFKSQFEGSIASRKKKHINTSHLEKMKITSGVGWMDSWRKWMLGSMKCDLFFLTKSNGFHACILPSMDVCGSATPWAIENDMFHHRIGRNYMKLPWQLPFVQSCDPLNIWMFPKLGVPQNGWFIMENPIKMDDPYTISPVAESAYFRAKWLMYLKLFKTLQLNHTFPDFQSMVYLSTFAIEIDHSCR